MVRLVTQVWIFEAAVLQTAHGDVDGHNAGGEDGHQAGNDFRHFGALCILSELHKDQLLSFLPR